MNKIVKQYQFGHAIVELRLLQEMQIPASMEKFELESGKIQAENIDWICELEFTEQIAEPVKKFLGNHTEVREIVRKNMHVFTNGDRECRVLNFEGADFAYAVYVEEDESHIHTWVNHEIQDMLQFETIFVSLLALEKVMVQKEALILHSAYICRNEKAILFSAPSGTGKSTQASLWEKYRGTRTINGDRSLLIRETDGWYANGWPICGSSKICSNEAYPIHAIVMLHQAKGNEVRRLGIAEAMKKLMSQITINMWNTDFQIKAMDLIQQLVMEVPVYELGCDISEDAVKCLEKCL